MKKMKEKFISISLYLALGLAIVTFSSFDNQYDDGVVIDGIRWATRNVAAPGTFAAKPEDAGKFYQWNRKKDWETKGDVTNWNRTPPTGENWEKENDPCPSGWRIPTVKEVESLFRSGGKWTTLNGVNGFQFGRGNNILFLPAVGCRNYFGNGALFSVGASGYYWYNTPHSPIPHFLYFNTVRVFPDNASDRAYGFSVRCVLDE